MSKINSELNRALKALKTYPVGGKEYNACLRNVETLQGLADKEESKQKAEAQKALNDDFRERDFKLKEDELRIKKEELGIKKEDIIIRNENEKKNNVWRIVGQTAGIVIPAAVNVACLICYKRMGTTALAAEYVDDKILPRSYSDSAKSVQNLIKRG